MSSPAAASAASAASPAGLLAVALAAAGRAGQLLAANAGRTEVAAVKSSPTDIVTEMDRAAEDLIIAEIGRARPDDAFLAEERGAAGDAPVRWIIDPLDGTVNYLYGLPDWAVSIAAEVDGTVVAGVVAVPMRGETFSAVLGQGAVLDQRAVPGVPGGPGGGGPAGLTPARELRCRPAGSLSAALIGTGFGYQARRRAVQGDVVAALLPQVRDIRRGGSAATDLCSVAAGRLDGYYERGLNPWDYAAGALIAAEAGAVVGGLGGRPPGGEMTVAAGPGLFPQLASALAALDPERDA